MSRPRKLAPQVIHLDDDILVVDKPSGFLVGPGNQDYPGVPEALLGHPGLPDDVALRPVQRIDPDVSGAVLYARHQAAQRHFEADPPQFRMHVLVQGYLDGDRDIELPVYYDKRRGRIATSERRGTPACTRVTVLERIAGNTWCEVVVHSGRLEQIRPHLAAIAHPLTIDPHYGNESPLLLSRFKSNYRPSRRHEERPLVARLTMHVAAIDLTHPGSGDSVCVEAPLARDLQTTLRQLGRLT